MSARDNILARIGLQILRSQTQANIKSGNRPNAPLGDDLGVAHRAVREVIAKHERGPLPSFAKHDPVEHFVAECERVKTTLTEVASLAAVPIEIARYLGTIADTQNKLVGWPEFADQDWLSAGLDYQNRPAIGSDLVGVTGCFCAIGETGTLMLLGARDTPKITALLPETHICIVKKSRIVATMEDAFQLMREEIGEPPRATFFVSGPSRTADIEQTIVIGAHGPYRVHVVLVR